MQIFTTKGRTANPLSTLLAAHTRAYAQGEKHYRATALVTHARAVQPPADTTTPGWAAELVQETIAAYVSSLPDSVLGRLLADSIRVDAAAGITVPTRTDDVAAAFVGDGQPIPVMTGGFGGPNLRNQKLAIIAAYTQELANAPGAAPLVEAIAREAISAGADSVLLSNTAGTDAAPGGIFVDAVAIAGTDDAANDLAALAGSAPNTIRPIFVMNDVQAIGAAAANLLQGGFIGRASVIVSGHMPAGSVAYLDLQDLVFSVGDTVEISRSEEAIVNMESAPLPIVGDAATPVVAHPVSSLWQLAAFGVRVVLPLSWMLRRPGRVSLLTDAQW